MWASSRAPGASVSPPVLSTAVPSAFPSSSSLGSPSRQIVATRPMASPRRVRADSGLSDEEGAAISRSPTVSTSSQVGIGGGPSKSMSSSPTPISLGPREAAASRPEKSPPSSPTTRSYRGGWYCGDGRRPALSFSSPSTVRESTVLPETTHSVLERSST